MLPYTTRMMCLKSRGCLTQKLETIQKESYVPQGVYLEPVKSVASQCALVLLIKIFY